MSENKEYLEEDEIDLGVLFCDMWKGFRKMWGLFVVICVLGIAASVIYPMLKYTYIPNYCSQAIFSIGTNDISDEMNTSYGFYYNSSTASQLEKLLPYVLTSDIMQQKLKEELGTDYVNGSINISAVSNSNLFTMQVISGNATDAKQIVDAALKCLPEVCKYIIGETKLNMIEPPVLPAEPMAKRFSRKNPVKGLLAGMAVCLVILFVYAFLRKTIRKEEDFRTVLNLQCLGVLPLVKFKSHRRKTDTSISLLNEHVDIAFKETIRSLALKFTRKMDDKEKKVLLVTSTLPGEGKSTAAMNLALALEEENKKVLLIDMDLRNPTLYKRLRVSSSDAKLDRFLKGKEHAADVLVKTESGIYFLGAGKSCKNATTLITRTAFGEMIDIFRKNFDYIIIDTPPCGAISDAATISDYCDGICYIIRQDMAKQWQIMDGMQQVTSHGAPIIGGVLNGAERSLAGYGYGYGYGKYGKYGRYGYGYGYGEKKGKRDK